MHLTPSSWQHHASPWPKLPAEAVHLVVGCGGRGAKRVSVEREAARWAGTVLSEGARKVGTRCG